LIPSKLSRGVEKIKGWGRMQWNRMTSGSVALVSVAALGAGFGVTMPHATSQDLSVRTWRDTNGVDIPHVRVRLLANQRTIRRGPSPMLINDVAVPKSVRIVRRPDGLIDVVADLPLEKYVEGVVAGEMSYEWPIESLKAQAVAARSYFLAIMKKRSASHFDVDSSQLKQVFRALEDIPASGRAKIREAVAASKGLVLRSKDQYPFAAYYHSDCGGVIELPGAVWGKGDEESGVSCPLNPGKQWTYKISKKNLQKMLGLKRLKSMTIVRRSGGGRALELELLSAQGRKTVLGSQKLRRFIGFSNLKSTLFNVNDSGLDFEFVGRGYGHGVGLCQMGARELAVRGKSFRQILDFYYPGTRFAAIRRGNSVAKRL
jgi:stage II sporulation protein D